MTLYKKLLVLMGLVLISASVYASDINTKETHEGISSEKPFSGSGVNFCEECYKKAMAEGQFEKAKAMLDAANLPERPVIGNSNAAGTEQNSAGNQEGQ